MGSRYKHNYKAFGDAVLRSPAMVAEMRARAERVKSAAEADAAGYVDTGEYLSSFDASASVAKRPNSTARAVGVVSNVSEHAFMVEFGTQRVTKNGTVTTPARHTLSRALDAAG
jgi:hypothetical protein